MLPLSSQAEESWHSHWRALQTQRLAPTSLLRLEYQQVHQVIYATARLRHTVLHEPATYIPKHTELLTTELAQSSQRLWVQFRSQHRHVVHHVDHTPPQASQQMPVHSAAIWQKPSTARQWHLTGASDGSRSIPRNPIIESWTQRLQRTMHRDKADLRTV
jgi:hypothetical protein